MVKERSKPRGGSETLTPRKATKEQRITSASGPVEDTDGSNITDMDDDEPNEDESGGNPDIEASLSSLNHVPAPSPKVLRSHQHQSSPNGAPVTSREEDQISEQDDAEGTDAEQSAQILSNITSKRQSRTRQGPSAVPITKQPAPTTKAAKAVSKVTRTAPGAARPNTITVQDSGAGHVSKAGPRSKSTAGAKRGPPSNESPIRKRQRTSETKTAEISTQEPEARQRKAARKTAPVAPPHVPKKLPRPTKGPEDMAKANAARRQKAAVQLVGEEPEEGDAEESDQGREDGAVEVDKPGRSPEQVPSSRQAKPKKSVSATSKHATRSTSRPSIPEERAPEPASSPVRTGQRAHKLKQSRKTGTSKSSSAQRATEEVFDATMVVLDDANQVESETEKQAWDDEIDFQDHSSDGPSNTGSQNERLQLAFEGVKNIREKRMHDKENDLVQKLLVSLRKMRESYAALANEARDSENYKSLCRKLDSRLWKSVDSICHTILETQQKELKDLAEEKFPDMPAVERRKKEPKLLKEKLTTLCELYVWVIPHLVLTVKAAMDSYKGDLQGSALGQINTILDWTTRFGHSSLRPKKILEMPKKAEILEDLNLKVLYNVRILRKTFGNELKQRETQRQRYDDDYIKKCRELAKKEKQLLHEKRERQIQESHIRMNEHMERLQIQKDSRMKQLHPSQMQQANRRIDDGDDVERVRMFGDDNNTTQRRLGGNRLKEWLHDELLALASGLERFTGKDRYARIAGEFCLPGRALESRDMDEIFAKSREFKADLVNDAEQHPEREPLPDWVLSIQ